MVVEEAMTIPSSGSTFSAPGCRRFQYSLIAWLHASDWMLPVTNVKRDVPDSVPVPLEELEARGDIFHFWP